MPSDIYPTEQSFKPSDSYALGVPEGKTPPPVYGKSEESDPLSDVALKEFFEIGRAHV